MRLIDADELIKSAYKPDDFDENTQSFGVVKAFLRDIENAPTIDPVKHGKWVHTDWARHWTGKDECSECKYHTVERDDISYFNFCPNCGAKMDLE